MILGAAADKIGSLGMATWSIWMACIVSTIVGLDSTVRAATISGETFSGSKSL